MRCDHLNHQRRAPPPPNTQTSHQPHQHKRCGNPQTLQRVKGHQHRGLGNAHMGTTPGLGTAPTGPTACAHCATTATKPTTSERGMNPPPKQQLDQLECMASLSNPVREFASKPVISLTMNHEMSKTFMVTVQTMFIIISTNVCCGT